LLAADAIANFMRFDIVPVGNTIELDVRYIGADPAGAVFHATYDGMIVVPDGENPPPLRAEVTTVERAAP
jgi:hypothetical protein